MRKLSLKIILLLPLLLVGCAAHGQLLSGRVSAQVTASDGSPLPGVTIGVKGIGCDCSQCADPEKCDCCPDERMAVTDSDGRVTFTLPVGEYWLSAEIEGFGAASARATVRLGETSEVTIVLDSELAEEITVNR